MSDAISDSLKAERKKMRENEKRADGAFEGWSRVIDGMKFRERAPMWEGAIKYLITKGDMEPTLYLTLTQEQIQTIIHNGRGTCTFRDMVIDLGFWIRNTAGSCCYAYNASGAEVWLAYLMATRYAVVWDGERWADI